MRKSHRKKVAKKSHHKLKLPVHLLHFRGYDNTKDIDKILSEKKLVQDVLGLSNDLLGKLFSQAVELLTHHQYTEALAAFKLLIQINPFVSDFWIGQALAKKADEKYSEAIKDFLVAQTLDPTRPEYYPAAIDCCLEIGQVKQARKFLKRFIRICCYELSGDEQKFYMNEMRDRKEKLA